MRCTRPYHATASTRFPQPLHVHHRPDPYESAWDVVLVRTPRGEDEIRRPIIPLSKVQQDILMAIDGVHSLHELVRLRPELKSHRLSRDCARLLAFGVVKTVRGELPQALVVQAMNLTIRVPAEALRRRLAAAQAEASGLQDSATAGVRPPAAPRRTGPLVAVLAALLGSSLLLWWWSQR